MYILSTVEFYHIKLFAIYNVCITRS